MSGRSDNMLERIASALERLAAVQEREEKRAAVRGLLKFRSKYPADESEQRAPLQVVK